MATLCQILAVYDEKQFLEDIRTSGCSMHCSGSGWGRFIGEIPAIHSTLVIEIEESRTEYFRVLYTETWLRHKEFDQPATQIDRSRYLTEGNLTVQVCNVYAVRIGE
jgi:hypothetical protein